MIYSPLKYPELLILFWFPAIKSVDDFNAQDSNWNFEFFSINLREKWVTFTWKLLHALNIQTKSIKTFLTHYENHYHVSLISSVFITTTDKEINLQA